METYWIRLEGQNLDISKIFEVFADFKTDQHVPKHGKDHTPRIRIFAEPAFQHAAQDNLILQLFLVEVERRMPSLQEAGIEDVEVWALYDRNEQINAWLTKEEIGSLHRLNATFCWSVMVSYSEDPDRSHHVHAFKR